MQPSVFGRKCALRHRVELDFTDESPLSWPLPDWSEQNCSDWIRKASIFLVEIGFQGSFIMQAGSSMQRQAGQHRSFWVKCSLCERHLHKNAYQALFVDFWVFSQLGTRSPSQQVFFCLFLFFQGLPYLSIYLGSISMYVEMSILLFSYIFTSSTYLSMDLSSLPVCLSICLSRLFLKGHKRTGRSNCLWEREFRGCISFLLLL